MFRRALRGPALSIAVTSGKGGVGKTQVSSNLSIALAQQGLKVLVVDADLGLASLDLAFGVTPEYNLLSVIEKEKKAKDILVEGPAGVQLLAACPGRYEMANLSRIEQQALVDAVEEASQGFDVVLIDTGAGIGSNSVIFAGWAEQVVLVSTPDPTALRDAYAMAKVLHKRSGVKRLNFIANQVASDREGIELHERLGGIVRRFLPLELDYLGPLRRDDVVRNACLQGVPFMMGAPDSTPARAIRAMAKRLSDRAEQRSVQ
jgi:flagellar biosynthesis protein FlhG